MMSQFEFIFTLYSLLLGLSMATWNVLWAGLMMLLLILNYRWGSRFDANIT